ncbi:hypothetical protein [Halochromatium glycolicum]|nr:hypothetical protein [Halochromatium glycolicum]
MSDPELAKTLWTDETGKRCFLIPDAQELPPGDFALRTAAGRERKVHPDALTSFEVSTEEGVAWTKAQLGTVVGLLKSGLKARLLGGEKGERASADEQGDDARRTSPTPGMDLLADITETPRERFDGDGRAVARALRTYLEDVAETTIDAVSGEPEREQGARQRMRSWAETLRAHGIAAPEVEDPDRSSEDASTRTSPEAEHNESHAKTPKDDSQGRS